MKNQYHILNGDALKDQFPEALKENIIVARECLIDGDVQGKDLEQFFHTRAQFISNFEDYNYDDYFQDTVSEFEKIRAIPENAMINLWFEDDLFCQVNFWFVVHLIVTNINKPNLFLIRPEKHNQYGFGGYDKDGLTTLYKNKVALTSPGKIADLWKYYQRNNLDELVNSAKELESTYPFILPAIKAHCERIPTDNDPGRPTKSLLKIMKELNTSEFIPVFKEFSQREYIYGFGDLQVKRLYDEIMSNE